MVALPSEFHKVGRLRVPIARAIGRKSGDIYVNDAHLRHIRNKHGAELAAVGLDARAFVELVAAGFNRVYEGTEGALLLVKFNGKPKVAAIRLTWGSKKQLYEVATATVMGKEFLAKRKLLWQR